ncbi:NAD(P)H-dependent flavin oxidoreductase [Dermacoccaceae bacterium W4C1]
MDLARLAVPVLAAPMAGGISTPALVHAVGEAGGLGFLAAGYRTPAQVGEQIAQTRALGDHPFGVNVFVPATGDPTVYLAEVSGYAYALKPVAERFGSAVPQPDWDDTDQYEAKIDLLAGDPVAVVSFTFGCPSTAVVERLHTAGSHVVITVTDADEALAAARAGADALCVQAAAAGGHRGTHSVTAIPNDLSLMELIREVASVSRLPLIAAGGITEAKQVSLARQVGADAVQVGTALLLCPEAGTSDTHRAGLVQERFDHTVLTRAYSGRLGRGLSNAFAREFDRLAPPCFPVVDQLSKPLRAAAGAAADPDWVNLWAGTGWRSARAVPAAQVIAALAGAA